LSRQSDFWRPVINLTLVPEGVSGYLNTGQELLE
jgi:hypothetical protein